MRSHINLITGDELPLIEWGSDHGDDNHECTCWYWMRKGQACPMHSNAQRADFNYVSGMLSLPGDEEC